jgi:hypothetical protein
MAAAVEASAARPDSSGRIRSHQQSYSALDHLNPLPLFAFGVRMMIVPFTLPIVISTTIVSRMTRR